MKLLCGIEVSTRVRKNPPHVHKPGVCFSIDDFKAEIDEIQPDPEESSSEEEVEAEEGSESEDESESQNNMNHRMDPDRRMSRIRRRRQNPNQKPQRSQIPNDYFEFSNKVNL